jgi:hypothetical protein
MKLILALSLASILSFTVESEARERLVLSSSVKEAGRSPFERRDAIQRTSTQPRPNTGRPVERVIMNSNVYSNEGSPGVRHEEVSSRAAIFHLRSGRVVPGHAFDY